MSNYIFYPGCSMESSAKSYYISSMFTCKVLGISLKEIDDWNCCGATEYLSLHLTPAYALIARNLALAEQQANGSKSIVAPCSACYLNLAKADHYMHESKSFNNEINEALAAGGLKYTPGKLAIRHLVDVIVNDIGLEKVKEKVVKPLAGLRVAPYLGCMLPRPDYNERYSDAEHPEEFDNLLASLGAEVVDFPLKTACCGGHMTQIGPDTAFELIRHLVASAVECKADMIATVCPMCQMNLDAYQGQMNSHFHTNYRMPIVFFTQLMGIAFGEKPERLGFGQELVNAGKALGKINSRKSKVAAEAVPAPAARKEGLPMPPPLAKQTKTVDISEEVGK